MANPWDDLAIAIKAAIDATEAGGFTTAEAGQTYWSDVIAQAVYNNSVAEKVALSGTLVGAPIANTLYKELIPKAWVRFNGTEVGPNVPILGSFNVSSVTKIGTGQWTVTFLTPMADLNYVVLGTTGTVGTAHFNATATTYCDVYNRDYGGLAVDLVNNGWVVFGNQ